MKKLFIFLSICLLPINILAYSDEVYLGGQTIGIDAKVDGVLVVGFYKIAGSYNNTNPKLVEGDYIISVNGEDVTSSEKLSSLIEENAADGSCILGIRRGSDIFEVELEIIEDSSNYKTGIYIKDSITGIGTITFIDPANMMYGALGHEIIESTTSKMIDINDGIIFENSIISIDKSEVGSPGSKNASFNYENVFGSIYDNTNVGIYGEYTAEVNEYSVIKVGPSEEVKIGPATLYTVTKDNEVEVYDIEITKINETSDIKNLTIEITDEKLLELSGGVVQGMSGSPIIQNGKLVGSLTHVTDFWEYNV
ncbi:MAG: SpoIVB peptidase S55 domain-containing protein [bacterium]